jgi:hypothetical protein
MTARPPWRQVALTPQAAGVAAVVEVVAALGWFHRHFCFCKNIRFHTSFREKFLVFDFCKKFWFSRKISQKVLVLQKLLQKFLFLSMLSFFSKPSAKNKFLGTIQKCFGAGYTFS